MISNFCKKNLIFRMKLMKYIFFASYIDWDAKTSKFIPPPLYYQWNGQILTYALGIYPSFLTIHLIKKLFNETIFSSNDPAKVLSYMLGWGENMLSLLMLTIGIWTKKRVVQYSQIFNELNSYTSRYTRIQQNYYTNSEIKLCDKLILVVSILVIIIPISFVRFNTR